MAMECWRILNIFLFIFSVLIFRVTDFCLGFVLSRQPERFLGTILPPSEPSFLLVSVTETMTSKSKGTGNEIVRNLVAGQLPTAEPPFSGQLSNSRNYCQAVNKTLI